MEANGLRIDERTFEKALRTLAPDETVKVLGITSRCLSGKGLNFLSDLYQASVRYTVTSRNEMTKSERLADVIIKTEPLNEVCRNMVRQQDMFVTELKVLRDVLPRIKESVGGQIGPRLFYGSENPRALIMENLATRKFVMKDRQKGLPFEHCRVVVEQIAKFHAGSVAVHEKDPEAIEWFKDSGIVSTKSPASYIRLMEVSLLRIGKQLQKWSDEECSASGGKLIKLAGTIGARCMDAYNYDSDEFCVLNHGDCWINNMMFKENEKGEPVDLLLVDYQMSVYTSPAVDLLYFLNICPEFAVKYDNDEYFLDQYLATLKETMERIGCKTVPPTMQQLKEAMHKRRAYAIMSGIVLYLRMMANKEDTEDFGQILMTYCGETKMDVFKNPDAVKLARKMIPVMNRRGDFD